MFTLSFDSVACDTLRAVADCWIEAPRYVVNQKLLIVLKVQQPTGLVAEQMIPVDDQLIDRTLWSNVSVVLPKFVRKPGTVLKAYLWNTSKRSVIVDDFRVTLLKPQKST